MAFPLLFACTPENNNNGGGSQNNYDDLVVTGDALEITEYSVKLTGFANLPLDMGNAEVGIMYDKQQSFEGAKKLLAAGLDGNNKFTVTVTGLEPSTTYYYKSFVQNGMAMKYGEVKSFTTNTPPVPETVDMGTVVNGKNVKWALCNLGALKPEDYGDYYAWGETEPKSDYSWETYKFRKSSSGPLSKYDPESSDDNVNKRVLDAEDDVARIKLGGKWRMPSDEEWKALMTTCTWIWTTQNGINGRLVTAANGNSIFLPAAGGRYGTGSDYEGAYGNYWSSSLSTDDSYHAWNVDFSSRHLEGCGGYRYHGHSVRPVSE